VGVKEFWEFLSEPFKDRFVWAVLVFILMWLGAVWVYTM
jgi:hypothetical protein